MNNLSSNATGSQSSEAALETATARCAFRSQTQNSLELAQAEWKQGQYAIALARFLALAKVNPSNPDFAIRAAQACMNLAEFDKAYALLAPFAAQPETYPAAAALNAIFRFDGDDLPPSLERLACSAAPMNACSACWR